ncbi:MAG TPA: ATP-binding protein [Gammaproteobacteria bacterium]|nr:ATP-binding protein [Gammaproteobacteria bacterium]
MLSDQHVIDVLHDWSFWETSPPSAISRQLELPKQLHTDLALVIQGVRRCGKSTLLAQLPKYYNFPLAQCYYCNFEDPRLMDELNHRLLSRIVTLARKKIPTDNPCYFFFDEIQNVQEWEKWLHTQLERPQNNYFILTGSNSRLLSGEFATALTGRHITLELFPFSFAEYKLLFPKKNLEDYLLSGGFPRPLTFGQPYQLLQEYFHDIIFRDVLKRVHARTPQAIKQVAKMAFDSCGSELSFRKIAAVTDLSVDTVKSYLEACEDAYLLFACPYFAFSEKKQLSKQKKYYPIDSGMRYAITSTTGRDLGKSLELMIFLRLRQTHEQVFYWHELHKGEVDFVTMQGKTITPYQVTWEGLQPRHEKALQYFYQHFPQANEAVFITHDNADEFL